MEHHKYSLSLPLLPFTAAAVSAAAAPRNESPFLSNYGIALRLISVVFIGIISLWANHEASKGFEIAVVNDVKGTPAGQRFDLFYVSNDEATREILNASKFVENLLFPSDRYPKKDVRSVHLRLAHRNLSHFSAVEKLDTGFDFFINLSPSIFKQRDVRGVMSEAILRGMSWIWLWDGEAGAPAPLLAGMVEYVSIVAGFGQFQYSGEAKLTECDLSCWNNKDPGEVAQFLDYHEGCRKGFIQRLNRGLKSRWDDRTMKDALPAQLPCGSINYSGTGRSTLSKIPIRLR